MVNTFKYNIENIKKKLLQIGFKNIACLFEFKQYYQCYNYNIDINLYNKQISSTYNLLQDDISRDLFTKYIMTHKYKKYIPMGYTNI